MKYKIFGMLIFFSVAKNLLAINQNIHQLKNQFETNYKKESSFKNLEKLVEIYLIDSKYKESEKLLKEFKVKNIDKKYLSDYYLLLAKTFKYQLKNDLALMNYNLCGKLLSENQNSEKKINFYLELLEFYRKTSDFDRAFSIIEKLKKNYKVETIRNEKLLIFYYNRVAAVLNERNRGSESISLSLKAVDLAKKNEDVYAEATSYNELGFSFKNKLNNKKSIEFYEKAYNLWLSIGCYRDAVHAKYNKNIVISHNNLLPSKEQILINLQLIKLIDSLNVDYPTSYIYTLIEFHHVILKKWELAYNYRLRADTAAQLEQENANFKILTDLKEKYENEQLQEKNNSIQKLSKERKEKLKLSETRFWWIFSFFVFVTALSTILFILWRKNNLQNKELIEQNTQKTFLIQEVHHRVKNNLQFMKSVLLLQESLDELTAKETINDISRRIDAVSMVHEMLYIDNPGIDLSVKDYLEKLIAISSSLYSSEKKIAFKLEIAPVLLPIEKLIAIGIICSELLANSVKHVLADNENLIFSIQLIRKSKQIEMLIKDNGTEIQSISEDKRFKLGMRIIEIFSKKLNAKTLITTESSYNFHISFSIDSI